MPPEAAPASLASIDNPYSRFPGQELDVDASQRVLVELPSVEHVIAAAKDLLASGQPMLDSERGSVEPGSPLAVAWAIKCIRGRAVPPARQTLADEHTLKGMQGAQEELHGLLAIPCLTSEERGQQIERLRKEWNIGVLGLRIVHLGALAERARVREVARTALASASLKSI